VAGALSLQDGARVVALRSRLLASLPPVGAMAAVALPAEQVREDLAPFGGAVSVAAVNGPSSVVVTGTEAAVADLVAGYAARGLWVRRLPGATVGGHSAQVDGVREELLGRLTPVAPRRGEVAFFSSVAGGLVDTASLDAEYWWRNLREPVLFAPAVGAVVGAGHRAFVEVSPHPVVAVGVEEAAGRAGVEAVVIPTLRRGDGGLGRFYTSAGEAWVRGVAVDWAAVHAGSGARRVPLPIYPFQRRPYWLPTSAGDTPAPAPRWEAVVQAPDADASNGHTGTGHGTEPDDVVRQLAGMPVGDRDRMLADVVCTEAAAVLGHPSATAVDSTHTFKDLGFDSVMAVELRKRLSAALDVRLPPTLVFDYPTPKALAVHLAAKLFAATTTTDPRQVFASIPLDRLRAAGLWDVLTELARGAEATTTVADGAGDGAAGTPLTDTADLIDDMDVESLVRMSFSDSDF
jgi:acyl transferase domain-containing protein